MKKPCKKQLNLNLKAVQHGSKFQPTTKQS